MSREVEQLSIKIDLQSGDFQSQIRSITSALSSLDKQFRQLDKGLENDSFQHYALQVDKAKKSIELLNKQIETQKKAQAELNKTLEEQKKKRDGMDKDSKEYAKLDKQIAKNQRTYDNMSNAITRNQQKIKNYANEILNANTAVQKLADNSKTLEQRLSSIKLDENLKMSGLSKELEQASIFFNKLKLEVGKLETEKGFNAKKIQEYNAEIEKLSKKQTELTSKQKALKLAIEQTENKISATKAGYGEAGESVESLEMALASLKDELRGVDSALDSNADSLREYKTNVNDLEKENSKLGKTLGNIRLDTYGETLQQVGKKMKDVGSTLTQNVTTPIVTAGVAVAKMTMDYQKSLNKVGTITGLSGKALQDYGEEAIRISNETGMAVTDINEAIYQAVSSGVEVSKATQFVADASKLAVGGFTDTASAVELLSTAYNIYGDSLGSTIDVSDKLMKIQNLGVTTIDELTSNMGEAMSIAGAYGVSFDNVAAAFAKVTTQGRSTAEAGRVCAGLYRNIY